MIPSVALKIRTQLIVGLVTLALALVAAIVAGWITTGFATRQFHESIEDHVVPLRDAKILTDLYGVQIVEMLEKVRVGRVSPAEAARVIADGRLRVDEVWERLLPALTSGAEQVSIDSIEPLRVAADQLAWDAVAILRARDTKALNDLIDLRLFAVMEPLLGLIDTLSGVEIEAIKQDQQHLSELESRIRAVYLMLALCGLIVAAGVVFLIVKRIARPIAAISVTMRDLAEGNLLTPLPIRVGGDEIGNLAHAVEVFRATAIKLTEQAEELRIARDQAEEATRAKSSFLAVMSHEIRTPMNGVTAMAEMLDQTDLTDDQHGMTSVIRASAQALLTIINDILDFSKIEAGKLEIESTPLSLTDVVEEAAELVAGRAAEKTLRLTVDIDADVPDRLLGDPTRLRQILINLAGNAIKFTESGGVVLHVMTLRDASAAFDGSRACLRFEVTDTGIGLTAEQQTRLFQPFQQADSSTSRRFGGTGLGLSICHKLCVMMGGDIGVDSCPGEGSTFWFELPFPLLAPEPLTPAVAISDARVVAIGFNGTAESHALAGILHTAGIGAGAITWIRGLDDPVAAIAAAGSASLAGPGSESGAGPRLVVIIHAGDSGDTALAYGQHIIESALEPKPAVILAAPRALASTLAEADRIGLLCTVTLPLRRRRLWQAVAAALGRASLDQRGNTARDQDASGWEPPPIEEAIAAGTLILVAEDNPINQTVIRRMLTQRGYAIEMAGNGVEALTLYQPGRYGLLLTDFHMPEMDGFALTHEIRCREQGYRLRLPIVALTADALPGTEQRCLDADMDGYLTKPIDSRLLAEALDRFLPLARDLRRPAARAGTTKPGTALGGTEPAAWREPAPAPAPTTWGDADIDPAIFDLEQLAQNFDTGDTDAMTFLNDFLHLVPGMIQGASDALAGGNPAAARDAVHTLKGSASSIGATRLGQLAADAQDSLDADDAETATMLIGLLMPTHEELVDATAPIRRLAPLPSTSPASPASPAPVPALAGQPAAQPLEC